MIFSSCTKDNDDLNSTMSSTKASFGNAVITRVDGEQWESADQIGIYMIDGEGAIDTYSNVPYSTSSSGDVASFSPSSSQVIYYKNSSESVAFWAYSPYDDELINNTAVVDISKNQSQPGLIDLLWAQTEAVYSKSNASVACQSLPQYTPTSR